jgi:cytochrome c
MDGLELNKLAASILLAGVIAMGVGFITDILYSPNLDPDKRGYYVEVEDEAGSEQAKKQQKEQEKEIDIAALMQKADAETGKAVFKKCSTCHTISKGGPNRVGPNLWNVYNSEKASDSKFAYSNALKNKGGTWDNESLFHFINNPRKYISGTKMSFGGLRSPKDIANLIAYLKQQSDKSENNSEEK